jgi:hypothetical protein
MRHLRTMEGGTGAASLLEMASGMWTTQALFAAVELGLADALAARGPMHAEPLARQTGCDPGAVERLLRGLAALGVCEVQDDGAYALTAYGAPLAGTHPQSLQAWVLLAGRQQWALWSGFTDSVRTGRFQQPAASGSDRFQRLQGDTAGAGDFHRAMAALTRQVALAVASQVAVMLPAGATVVDVGGGSGELLCAVLNAAPVARGLVFDREHAAATARAGLAGAGLQERAAFVAGDFFADVPSADLVLLKSVLHDWDDERCVQLLGRIAASLLPGGAVAVVERLMPDRVEARFAHRRTCRTDLNMLVATGGRERRLAELTTVLGAAGLRVDRVLPAALDFALVIARAA